MFLQADMRMLEDGYYKSSLALHPVQSAEMTNINDNELMQYLRSKTEVKLLCEMEGEGKF
jgi:hypothetical protein